MSEIEAAITVRLEEVDAELSTVEERRRLLLDERKRLEAMRRLARGEARTPPAPSRPNSGRRVPIDPALHRYTAREIRDWLQAHGHTTPANPASKQTLVEALNVTNANQLNGLGPAAAAGRILAGNTIDGYWAPDEQ